MSRVECPATLSRHLILPQRTSDECPENIEASSKIPSFCVLLHGSLKVNFFIFIIIELIYANNRSSLYFINQL